MEYVRFAFSALFILIGLFITICGVIGYYKFKFILNRMHAAALIDTLGLFFIILGLIVASGWNTTSLKLFLVVVFLWLTSPVTSHLISKLIYLTDSNTEKETVEIDVDQYKDATEPKEEEKE